MIRTISSGLAVGAALALLAAAGEAQGSVTIIADGQAKACERAAVRGEHNLIYERACTVALETEPLGAHDRAGTFVNRGVFKLRRGEFKSARADFDAAIRIQPQMGEAYVNRAAAHIGARQYQAGLADVDRGLALGVEEPHKAYFNRALAYEGLDDMKSAYLDYRKALELAPDWAAPQKELARFSISRR
jgi:tetratricopeptide (TPR) repeat protein